MGRTEVEVEVENFVDVVLRRTRGNGQRKVRKLKLRVLVDTGSMLLSLHRDTIRALGLHRIGDTVEVPDNLATRGMVRQVRFLVEVVELPATHEEKA